MRLSEVPILRSAILRVRILVLSEVFCRFRSLDLSFFVVAKIADLFFLVGWILDPGS